MLWAKIIVSLIIFSTLAFANEHGEPAKEDGHGGVSAAEAAYSGKQTQEWSEVQTKLSALKSKVEAQENVVKALLGSKHGEGGGGGHESAPAPEGGGHSGGAAAVVENPSAKIEQLKKEHEKLQALIADYNKMNSDYESRFPEKGLKESRVYRRLDPQANQFEKKASSYEESLQRLQNKIMRQYPNSSKNLLQERKLKKELVAKPEESKKESSKKGDVTEQIILKK